MSGGVFVLKYSSTLVAIKPTSFTTQDDFQGLLADFPALLANAQGGTDGFHQRMPYSNHPQEFCRDGRNAGLQTGSYSRR
jgi:hypothetical protein